MATESPNGVLGRDCVDCVGPRVRARGARVCVRVHVGVLVSEWAEMIARAYEQAPRTYQDAYKAFLTDTAKFRAVDQGASFHAGWHAACNALANRLVEWLDEPAGDDVSAFLGFVEELRRGDLS